MGSIGPLRLLSRRLSSSSASYSKPPNLGGWTPIVADYIPNDADRVDIGRWLFVLDASFLQKSPEKNVYKYVVKAVGDILNDEEKAKKVVYHISSNDRRYEGFCAYVDKETKNKLSAMKGVRFVVPDYYYATRLNHPEIRQVTM
ncbi:hypothetical protein FRX31_023466 [Thalictrum thalictroides]|uniref:MORF/ORRM1/DAG-like MORF domain-containing protein n=1 Tax=Thalictrum thalictroides TaxID=46969 RepID=A0A7J6VQA4_THATH|nr:hypothetical protein FRX31_023466 [Thalictrum thalictroides]